MKGNYKLVVTGANSAALVSDFKEPVRFFLTEDEALVAKNEWVSQWLLDDYRMTAAGIYLRGAEWRRAAIYPVIQGKE